MTWQVAYIARLLQPNWPCSPVGLLSLAPVALEIVFPLLLVTPFPIAVLLGPQSQPATCPFSVVHQMFPCLLEALLAATILPKWRAYLPYDFPIVVAAVSAAHSLPVARLFCSFLHV